MSKRLMAVNCLVEAQTKGSVPVQHARRLSLAFLIFLVPVLSLAAIPTRSAPLKLTYSTYLGGRTGGFTMIRDVTTDAQGNIYVTGGTASTDFPTTPGAYQRSFKGGPMDVFVTKLSPQGQIVWSTLLGGPEYDRAYAIEVDGNGYVYVAGRAGRSFPTTTNAFQRRFEGWSGGEPYHWQNAFVAKLKPDGSGLEWASYFGSGQLIRDLDLDAQGDIYVHSTTGLNGAGYSATDWFTNAFQKTPPGADDTVVAKIKGDGTGVIWATYLGGGTSSEGSSGSLRVNARGEAYSLCVTSSTDMPTTPGAYQRKHAPGVERDFHLAKLSSDGPRLIFGTYLGGSAHEQYETHNLALDAQGNAVIAAGTTSSDFPTTPGVYNRTFNGGGYPHGNYPGDVVVAKISADGTTLMASTFFGGRLGESVEGIAIDRSGNIYVTGATGSPDLPTTPGAFQRALKGVDAFVVKFSPDLRQVLYSSYIGGGAGKGTDLCRCATLDPAGNFIIAGETDSTDWPTLNGLNSSFPAAPLAKFSAVPP